MKVTFKVEVELNKVSGPYVSKESLIEALESELEGNAPSEVSVDDSTYEVLEFNVVLM